MVSREEVVRRAERLRVALFIYGTVRGPPRDAYAATFPYLYKDEFEMCLELDEMDRHLTNTCLEAECELRVKEFAALERLLGLVAAGEGDVEERVMALPGWAFLPAARDLHTLGWLRL